MKCKSRLYDTLILCEQTVRQTVPNASVRVTLMTWSAWNAHLDTSPTEHAKVRIDKLISFNLVKRRCDMTYAYNENLTKMYIIGHSVALNKCTGRHESEFIFYSNFRLYCTCLTICFTRVSFQFLPRSSKHAHRYWSITQYRFSYLLLKSMLISHYNQCMSQCIDIYTYSLHPRTLWEMYRCGWRRNMHWMRWSRLLSLLRQMCW